MIDIEMVKARYSKMTDDELLQFAEHQGIVITDEAVSCLYNEFTQRRLDTSLFYGLMKQRSDDKDREVARVHQKHYEENMKALWEHIFQLKKEGYSNLDIKQELLEQDLHPNFVAEVANDIPVQIRNLKTDAQSQANKGFILIIIGVILCCIGGRLIIYGAMLTLAGASIFLNALPNKLELHKRISDVIKNSEQISHDDV